MILTTLIAIMISGPFLWWYLVLRKYRSLKSIPGPRPLPILGNSIDIGGTPQELLKNCSKFSKQYGEVFKIYILNELKVFITKPELLEVLLNSTVHITKSNSYDLIKEWLGDGLLTSSGNKWKARRKMITPTFHFKILNQFLDVFNSCGNILVRKLSSEVGKDSVDIYPYINLCSLDMICETSMGVKTLAQEGNNKEYVEAVRGYLNIFITRIFSAVKKFECIFQFFEIYSTYKKYLRTLHNFTSSIILKRRKEKNLQKSKPELSEDGVKGKMALLDMLLESEDSQNLTNEDIREEIDTFMFEGHDTVTSGITFAMLALADNPQVQDAVYEEIMLITGKENRNVTMQQVIDARYLEIVLKEAQRMYPPVPFVERRLEIDCRLGDYDFPKGTVLTLFLYGMNYNEKYFPEPQKFDPDRFLPEIQAKRHIFAYLPFSAGPRNCIGQKFAMLEIKTIIMKVVKNFKILPVRGYKPDLGMAAVLRSYNGVCVQLQHRHQ